MGGCSGRKREITKIFRSLGLLPLPETLQQNCPLFPEASGFRVCCVFMVTLRRCPALDTIKRPFFSGVLRLCPTNHPKTQG